MKSMTKALLLGASAATALLGNAGCTAVDERADVLDTLHCLVRGNDAIGNGDDPAGTALFDRCYSPDATMEVYFNGKNPKTPDMTVRSPSKIAASYDEFFRAYTSTTHVGGNTRFQTLTATKARTLTDVISVSWESDGKVSLGTARYDDDLEKRDGVWRVTTRRVLVYGSGSLSISAGE